MKTRTFNLIALIMLICFATGHLLACEEPPTEPPPTAPEPNNSGGQSPKPQDLKEPNSTPGEGEQLADPVIVKSGAFNYTCQDLVIKGRAMDIIIERNYRSNAYNGELAIFDFSFAVQEYLKVTGVDWILPNEAYDIQQTDSTGLECKTYYTGSRMEFRIPPGGPYTVQINVEDTWCPPGTCKDGPCLPPPSPCCDNTRNYTYYYYINGSEYSPRFGHGWDMSYNIKLRDYGDPNTIAFFDGHNRRFTYHLKSGTNPAEYTPPAGRYDKLIKNTDGTYTLTDKHGEKYEFDTDGWISAIKDRNGNSITFGYSDSSYSKKLTKITDDLGRDITLNYNDRGLLSEISDFDERTWTYIYDVNNNNLTAITGPTGLVTGYSYKNDDTKPHLLETITDPNGQTWLTNYYDDDGRVWKQRMGDSCSYFKFNPDCNETTYTDWQGYDSNTVYNSYGKALKKTIYTNGLREDDPNYYISSYSYDANMNLTKEILPAGNWVEYEYDSKGNLTKIAMEPNDGEPNIVVSLTYESNFNFISSIVDPLSNKYIIDYNSTNGNLEKITFPTVSTPMGDVNATTYYTYNQYGQLGTITTADGIIIECVYYSTTDANDPNCGRIQKIILDANDQDPNALKITYAYKWNKYGEVVEINEPGGHITNYVYNTLGKITQVTNALGHVIKGDYNKNQKLIRIEKEVVDDSNQVVELGYNILDKITEITNPLGYITRFGYDEAGNLSDVNDAEENNTVYEYDERGLSWKVTDANGGVTEYSYTLNGDLAKVEDANGNITTYEYDGFNRLVCITYPDDTNKVYGYDKNSKVTGFTNRAGDTISYQYDALGRMTVKTRPSEPNIYFRYDIAGRLYDVNDGRAVSQGGGITSFEYDRVGRVTEVNDIEGRVIKYEYNERSLISKFIYPGGVFITYDYDSLNRLEKVKLISGPLTFVGYDYDELGRRTLAEFINGSNTVYEYDIADRLTKLTNNTDDSNITFDYADYDNVGNRLSMKIDDSNAHVYEYDELYQLTKVDYNDGDMMAYGYDALGNRTEVNESGNVTVYQINSLNQYTSVGGASYSYDENGSLTDDGSYEYYYDCENRLTDVNENNIRIASYKYDYAGRRVRKILYSGGSPSSMVKYCYDGDQVIQEFNGADEILRTYFYGAGVDEPVAMCAKGNGWYSYHYDGLGSVVAVSDEGGDIVERYSYDVFGKVTIHTDAGADGQWMTSDDTISSSSSIGNPYFFTGRCLDDETGLYYYRARYYKPELGRFLQPDPIGFGDGLNLYTYVGNNPLNWIDPWGLEKTPELPECPGTLGVALAFGGGIAISIGASPGTVVVGIVAVAASGPAVLLEALWQHRTNEPVEDPALNDPLKDFNPRDYININPSPPFEPRFPFFEPNFPLPLSL